MNNIIITHEEKCQGCNRCLRNCPIFGANIAYEDHGQNKVRIDPQRCIQCGHCVEVCEHGARDYYDDTERFFDDLEAGKAISILAAPAVRVNFGNYRQLFGYLKSKGVKAVYDVSLGADITTWAYLKVIEKEQLKTVIAQPCPPIVNYLERHQPELLKQLAPIHSPLMCTAIFIKKYTQNQTGLAFLSPCLGKSVEIQDPNTHNLVQYNVTFKKLQDYLKKKRIALNSFPAADYDEIGQGLGFLFSRPGGLRENVEAQISGAWVRQIEGPTHVYEYLKEYGKRITRNQPVPLLIDALNCSHGCNLGSGTCQDIALDDIDYCFNRMKTVKLNEAETDQTEKVPLYAHFDQKLDVNDFRRNYIAKESSLGQREPTMEECRAILVKMHKTTADSQQLNCSACGYDSCLEMARAIYHGINLPTVCIDYNRREIILEKEQLETKTAELAQALNDLERFNDERTKYAEQLKAQVAEITASIHEVTECSTENAKEIEAISGELDNIVTTAIWLRNSVITMQEKLTQFSKAAATIVSISRETDLVAINASIEASRSGLAGRGFAVIAQAVKNLAQQSKQIAESTINDQTVMNQMITDIHRVADDLEQKLNSANQIIANISANIGEASAKSQEVAAAAQSIVKYE